MGLRMARILSMPPAAGRRTDVPGTSCRAPYRVRLTVGLQPDLAPVSLFLTAERNWNVPCDGPNDHGRT